MLIFLYTTKKVKSIHSSNISSKQKGVCNKKIFVIRHGEIRWKKMGFLSYTDLPLTENGIRETEVFAKKLKKIKM
jgi:hypothetical protein